MTDKASDTPSAEAGEPSPGAAEPSPGAAEPSSARVVAAGVVVAVIAGGWFLLSHFAMHTDTADALGEALGVALGLLLVISIVGAVVSGRRRA